MKPPSLVCSLLCVAAATAMAQTQESASDLYRTKMAAHLTADQRIATYEKQLRTTPNDAKIQAKIQADLASAFIQKLRETTDFAYLNRASTLVDRMLAVDPQSYDGIRLSAEIETHRHNFPKAAQLATVLTERNPSDSGAYGLLGDCLMELGQYDKANDAYQRMLTLSPNLASYNRVAYQRFVTGKTDESLAWMATAVKAGSPNAENLAWCLVEFGDMLFKTGHTADAHAAYQMAIDQSPGYHRALAALGREYASAGEFQKAVEKFKQAQAVIPLPDYAAALAMLYAKMGRTADAAQQRQLIDVIDKLGQVNGEKGNRALALVYADENRHLDRAVALARAELETRKDVYTQDAIGWVLYRAGQQKEAEQFSANALAFHTPEPMFLYHAGIIAIAGGDAERGKDLLNQALALNPTFSYPESQDARLRTHSPETLHPGTDSKSLVGQVGNLRPIGNRPVFVERTGSSATVSVARDAPAGIVFRSCVQRSQSCERVSGKSATNLSIVLH